MFPDKITLLEAILIVTGCIISLGISFITFVKFYDSRKQKIKNINETRIKEEMSLKANWKKTDDIEKIVNQHIKKQDDINNTLTAICDNVSSVLNELCEQRRSWAGVETKKTHAIKFLLQNDKSPKSKAMLQSLDVELEKILSSTNNIKGV